MRPLPKTKSKDYNDKRQKQRRWIPDQVGDDRENKVQRQRQKTKALDPAAASAPTASVPTGVDAVVIVASVER